MNVFLSSLEQITLKSHFGEATPGWRKPQSTKTRLESRDTNREAFLAALADGPKSTGEIGKIMAVPGAAVRNIGTPLVGMGLVTAYKRSSHSQTVWTLVSK